jgi:hypothetical protein
MTTTTASVLYSHQLGLVPITMPAYSSQSNGLAEAFVGTLKRDYVDGQNFATRSRCSSSSAGGSRTTTLRRRRRRWGCAAPADRWAEQLTLAPRAEQRNGEHCTGAQVPKNRRHPQARLGRKLCRQLRDLRIAPVVAGFFYQPFRRLIVRPRLLNALLG